MAEQKFIFETYFQGAGIGERDELQLLPGRTKKTTLNSDEFFNFFRSSIYSTLYKVQLHLYPQDTTTPIKIPSDGPRRIHIFYESLAQFEARKRQNEDIKHNVGLIPDGEYFYYLGQREGEDLPLEKFQEIFNQQLRKRGIEIFSPLPPSAEPIIRPTTSNIPRNHQKTLDNVVIMEHGKAFNELVNELCIPSETTAHSTVRGKLAAALSELKIALIEEGDSKENRFIIEKTKILIDSTLDPSKIISPSEYSRAITKYQQEVSNLSPSQKILIAAITFLGALAGFIVGAVIGGVVSAGNPLAMLAAGATAAVIGAGVGGAVVGGGSAFFLSRFGVFKHDPVKAAAREFVEVIDDYRPTKR